MLNLTFFGVGAGLLGVFIMLRKKQEIDIKNKLEN